MIQEPMGDPRPPAKDTLYLEESHSHDVDFSSKGVVCSNIQQLCTLLQPYRKTQNFVSCLSKRQDCFQDRSSHLKYSFSHPHFLPNLHLNKLQGKH